MAPQTGQDRNGTVPQGPHQTACDNEGRQGIDVAIASDGQVHCEAEAPGHSRGGISMNSLLNSFMVCRPAFAVAVRLEFAAARLPRVLALRAQPPAQLVVVVVEFPAGPVKEKGVRNLF